MRNRTLKKIHKILNYIFHPKRYYKNIELCGPYCEFWARFVADRLKIEIQKGKLSIMTPYVIPFILRISRGRYKIFFTGENTHVEGSGWQKWETCWLWKNSPSLSLGFDYAEHPKYLRFPYWIEHIFWVEATKEDIADFVEKYNFSNIIGRTEQCAFICKKDYFGDRAQMADMVAQIMPINYPSDFRHNDDDMRGKYGDDKIAYLRQFRFNLCPENSNNRGYVTEKIFEAIKAGCVPIYWGNEGYPEPDILNPDAIVYLDKDNPAEGLALLRNLYEDPKAYAKFVAQPRFQPDAAEKIYAYYERLEQKLIEIIK